MNKLTTAVITLTLGAALIGCGSKTVSPKIASLPGVVTGIGSDGYPVVKSMTFTRSAAPVSRVLACMQVEVDGLIGVPVEIDGAARANGKAYAQLQFSNYVAFSLNVRDSQYRFDRLYNAGISGPAYELMASAYGSPENAFTALSGIADRLSLCASQ